MKIQKIDCANPARGAHLTMPVMLAALCAFTIAIGGCVSPVAWSAYDTTLEKLSSGAWKSDIASLERELLDNHPKLKTDSVSAEAVRSAAVAAMADVDSAADESSRRDAAIAGISKICAAVGDGHTRINASPTAQYPLALRFFPSSSDYGSADFDLYVYAVILGVDAGSESLDGALGKKVDSIGGRSVAEVLTALTPTLSVESKLNTPGLERLKASALRAESLTTLMNPMIMRGIGLADSEGLSFTAESSTYTVQEMTREDLGGRSWTYAIDPGAPTALVREHPELDIWHTALEDHPDTVYAAFRSCPSDPGTAFTDILRDIEANSAITKLIVDLRANSGGDSRPGAAFARNLGATALAKRRGGVVLLTGPYTFSSALMNTADILAACGARGDPDSGKAILAGEPMIEPIDHYGEIYRFSLPNSGLVVGRSKKFWRYSSTSGIAPASGFLSPSEGLTRAPTFEEYRRGEDPILELALSVQSVL